MKHKPVPHPNGTNTVPLMLLALVAVCMVLLPSIDKIPSIEFKQLDRLDYYWQHDPDMARELEDLRSMSVFYGVGTKYSHAETKHPGDSMCIDGGNVIQVWENPFTHHCAELSQIDEDTFGIRIIAKIKGRFEELTAFIDDADGLRQVEQYLADNSYMEITPK